MFYVMLVQINMHGTILEQAIVETDEMWRLILFSLSLQIAA